MKNNTCDHELCLDRFGRKVAFQINRPDETVLYVRKSDGSLDPIYRSTPAVPEKQSE